MKLPIQLNNNLKKAKAIPDLNVIKKMLHFANFIFKFSIHPSQKIIHNPSRDYDDTCTHYYCKNYYLFKTLQTKHY